jgi:excisionase family DNA binding protein
MKTSETRLLTVPEVAARLNVSRATAYKWVYDGRLPAVRLGGRRAPLRVPADELEAWLFAEPSEAA